VVGFRVYGVGKTPEGLTRKQKTSPLTKLD